MAAAPPPLAPSLKPPTNKKPTTSSSDPTSFAKRVLIVSAQIFPFSSWINSKKALLVWLTTLETKSQLDFASLKSYHRLETFDRFGLNGMVEYTARELHKEYKFTNVVCVSEEEMLRAALLRDEFGLQQAGQDYVSTLRFRDKVIMKTRLEEHHLRVPAFAAIENAIELYHFIEKHGYPVVVKPRRGYGSVNTTVIRTESDLFKFCETGFGKVVDGPLDIMVEAFVNGQMYHIDGFYHESKARLICPSRYVNTVVNFNENNFIAGYSLQKGSPLNLKLQQFMSACIDALQGPSLFPFHGEVWVDDKGDLVFCEVASRTGGGGIPTQILTLYGVYLCKTHSQYLSDEAISLETLDVMWNEREALVTFSVGWIFIYPKIGKVTMPKNCTESYILSYDMYAHSGQLYRDRKSCADAVCNILVRGDDNDELSCERNIHRAYQWFVDNSKWEAVD